MTPCYGGSGDIITFSRVHRERCPKRIKIYSERAVFVVGNVFDVSVDVRGQRSNLVETT